MSGPKYLDPKSLMAARLRSFRNRLRAGYRGSLRQRELEAEQRVRQAEDRANKAVANAERDKAAWTRQAQADFDRLTAVLAECRFEREVGCGTERVLTVRLACSQEMLYRAKMDSLLPILAQMLARKVERELLDKGDSVLRGDLRLMNTPTRAKLEAPR